MRGGSQKSAKSKNEKTSEVFMASPIEKLTALGQSLWYDNIERRLLKNGEIAGLISTGDIRGMTSNPSIFNNAISKSKDYDEGLIPMAWAGYGPVQIYEQLAVEDIRAAADLFQPLYEKTQRGDGYVSLEVSPTLANDTEGTLKDARRLWKWVDRPNLMIKIPATRAGLPAVRKAISDGINVNVTLIFSIDRYIEVIEAYLSGLEDRLKNAQALDHVASVASFFVSRLDTKVDKLLENIGSQNPEAEKWMGKLAIANTKLAYHAFREAFETERFSRLKDNGARYQRPLWASTSTKNPMYPDTLYVDTLIGPHTVNTAPPATFLAFRDHGQANLTVVEDLDGARKTFEMIESLGVSITQVTKELEEEGVQAFVDAFRILLKAVDERRQVALRSLGDLALPVVKRVERLAADNFPARIYQKDASLWTTNAGGQAEIKERLAWLDAPLRAIDLACEAAQLTDQLIKEGYTHALILGMGGSSLAPEVMSLVFGKQKKGLDLTILDSTDPAQVHDAAARSAVKNTVYVVSSKSGSTAEVSAFFDFFWQRAQDELGDKVGEHFIAITDPGTTLEAVAREHRFRKIFHGEAEVGGRYSALTAFGLVPAALMGLDAARLAAHGRRMIEQCRQTVPVGRNPALVLGAIIGEAAERGMDKLTIVADSDLVPFGAWLEQL
jgi:transaldolase/glucose-6-phosphate isomerase